MSCSPESVIYDEIRGELICVETGEVLQDRLIDRGPEWRAYTPEEYVERARVGSQLTNKVHDLGITTLIDTRSREGKALSTLHRKLRIANNRQRKLAITLGFMNEVIGRLGLPDSVNEVSGTILRRLASKGVVKERNMNAYVAAAVILACNYLKIPVDRDDVLKLCEVTRHALWKAMLKMTRDSGEYIAVKAPEPQIYLERLCNDLKLHAEVLALASKILAVAKKKGLTSGKGPLGLAAAAMYIASVLMDEKRTQREVAEISKVTEVTVRNRYRDIVDNITIVIEL